MSGISDAELVCLIRHGEPRGGDRYRGSGVDDPLSDRGWRQMREAVAGHGPWRTVVHSPMRRCAPFAVEVADRHRARIREEAGFREISFGDWEGRTAAQIEADEPGALGRYWADPVAHPPPAAERLEDFASMVAHAWQALVTGQPPGPVLVVTHGGTIRALLAHLLDQPLAAMQRIEVPYACMTWLRVQRRPGGAHASLVAHGTLAPNRR